MIKKNIARSGLALVAASALLAGTVVPANAAKRTTIAIVTSNELSGLNSSVNGYNLTINGDVGYLSGNGFYYYDDKKVLKRNTALGSYKIVSQKPFKVQYTLNKGRVWSDGTPITAVDLLLSHVVSSSTYSVASGLGDPTDGSQAPSFDSLGYGGAYDNHHVGLPTLSADKMSATIEYDAAIPDWEITGPEPTPVHALVFAL
jgi:ABC-type dipeptide transport system, periplasmic component